MREKNREDTRKENQFEGNSDHGLGSSSHYYDGENCDGPLTYLLVFFSEFNSDLSSYDIPESYKFFDFFFIRKVVSSLILKLIWCSPFTYSLCFTL